MPIKEDDFANKAKNMPSRWYR